MNAEDLPLIEPDDREWGTLMAQHCRLPFAARVRCACCGVNVVVCETCENASDVMCRECIYDD